MSLTQSNSAASSPRWGLSRLRSWFFQQRWSAATWVLLVLFVSGTVGSFWYLHRREQQLFGDYPDSPRRDWQIGDVRGVLETIRPLDVEVAAGQIARQRGLIVTPTMAGLGFVGLGFMYLSYRRSRRTATILAERARRLLDSEAALQRDKEIAESASHAMAEDRGNCLASGCTDYLTKPIEKIALLSAVARYLPDAVVGDRVPASAPVLAEQSARRATLKSSLADDPDMIDAIQEFVANLPCLVSKINQLLGEQKLSELRRVMHQIRGAGGGYGFDDLTQLAGELERSLEQGFPLEMIEVQVDSLISLVRNIEGFQSAQELNYVKKDSLD